MQRQPNRWSCLITAAANAMSIPVERLISEIGHDGSAEWSDQLEEPLCKVGFQLSEIVDACYKLGWAIIYIEAIPQAARNGASEPLYSIEKSQARLNWYIFGSKGVLLGMGKNHHHAVTNHYGHIYDPNGKDYNFTDIGKHNFNDIEAYLIFELRSLF